MKILAVIFGVILIICYHSRQFRDGRPAAQGIKALPTFAFFLRIDLDAVVVNST